MSEKLEFPELNYIAQCTICKLYKTNPGILKVIHDLRFHDNKGYLGLKKATDPILLKLGIKPFTESSLARHFRGHVNFTDTQYQHELRRISINSVLTNGRMDFDEGAMRKLYYNGSSGREDVDYNEMWGLFTKVAQRVEAINADPNAFRNENGKVNYNALGSWSSLVNNARAILTDIHKMRNSDKFLALILQRHTLAYGANIAQPLAEIMRQILAELKKTNASLETIEKVENLLEGGMAEMFSRIALTTLKQTRKDNKIPNAA